jgi:prenyltransferase beta subunit
MQKDESDWQIVASDPFRMSGVYWALSTLALLGCPLSHFQDEEHLVTWMLACYKEEEGSFAPNIYHDGNLLSTLSAVQIFALLGRVDELNSTKISSCAATLVF